MVLGIDPIISIEFPRLVSVIPYSVTGSRKGELIISLRLREKPE